MRKVLLIVLALVVVGVIAGVVMWNKPHNKVENATGVTVTADALSKEYTTNENAANAKYLNKALQVSGTVSEVDKNQDGGTMVVIGTSDPMGGVQCAMREKDISINKGQAVTIKGFCSGNSITGVSITDCVINK